VWLLFHDRHVRASGSAKVLASCLVRALRANAHASATGPAHATRLRTGRNSANAETGLGAGGSGVRGRDASMSDGGHIPNFRAGRRICMIALRHQASCLIIGIGLSCGCFLLRRSRLPARRQAPSRASGWPPSLGPPVKRGARTGVIGQC